MGMSIGTGNTAASPVPPHSRDCIALGGHNVQFYSDDAFLLDDLSRHIGSALGAGEAGLVIATKSHRDGLAQRLTARGLDLNLAATLGRYVALDAAETLSKFMVGGRPDAERFAGVVGGVIARATAGRQGERVRVAAFGEMVALLWTAGQSDAALRLEQLWNDLSRIHSFDLRCAYPMRAFSQADDGELIGKVCSAHSGVIPAESYTSITTQEQRLRAVALLQQKAQALESEVGKRKKAQLSLELSKAALADLLENALEGVQQIGADQVVVWANTALLNLLGYSAEEYVGYPLGQFYVQQEVFEEYWLRLMSREDIYDYPAELRCKDGSVKHVLIHSNG
ncbi:MAG: sensor histidine kinase, partial [Chloroflexi bacterium]|nr:sensor histidine kinase [Chloroflexota bacterium]